MSTLPVNSFPDPLSSIGGVDDTESADEILQEEITKMEQLADQLKSDYDYYVTNLAPALQNFPPNLASQLLSSLNSAMDAISTTDPQKLAAIPGFTGTLENTLHTLDQQMAVLNDAKTAGNGVIDASKQPVLSWVRGDKAHGLLKTELDSLDSLISQVKAIGT